MTHTSPEQEKTVANDENANQAKKYRTLKKSKKLINLTSGGKSQQKHHLKKGILD